MKKLLTGAALIAAGSLVASAWDAPTMGWSSWNAYGHRINENIIKSQAAAMAANGLKDAGYLYVNIDDGAFKGRDANGNLVIHPDRFPNGMKSVVDNIHSLGLKAGTYSDAGYNTCASFHGGDADGIGTGLYKHDSQDIDFLFKDLGFDFIKVDFCGGDPPHNSDALDLDEQERYTAIGEAIKATGREGIRFNVCRWAYPGTWVNDVATSWRTTEDIYLGWESVRGIIAQNLYLSAYARHGGFNDMDMLEVGRGMTAEEDKTHFGMWCMLSSPLLIGCDVTTITPETLALLTNPELIALNQDPLSIQAYVVNRERGVYTLVKDVEKLHGNTRAVTFYNPTDGERTVSLDFFDVNLGGNVKVRDLFERKDLGTLNGSMKVSIPAHGTRIYRLEAEERYERHLYEAETAWLSAYQELDNNQVVYSGIYEESDALSGGAKAGWLGMRPDNDIIWRDVYSPAGGDYELTLAFISGADRAFILEVNGETIKRINGNSGAWDNVGTVTVNVNLKEGDNAIRLYTDANDWMPDFDYMQIVPAGKLDVYRHKLQSVINRAERIDPALLPHSFAEMLAEAIKEAGKPCSNASEYNAAIEKMENTIELINNAMVLYNDYMAMRSGAVNNAEATSPSVSLTALREAIAAADEAVNIARESEEIKRQTQALISAIKTFLQSSDTELLPDAYWDMTLLLDNPRFDSDSNGWDGAPVWGSGCAEYWNRSFEVSQTLSGLKPGSYSVMVNALYRTGANDGGKAYNDNREVIPALFFAGDEEAGVASLYSHNVADHEDLYSNLSGTHVLNGYVNSMYGASRAFALDLYKNSIDTTVGEDGKLKIGLRCDRSNYDCWCCFDNFRLLYHGVAPAVITEIMTDKESAPMYYDLTGLRVKAPSAGNIYIRKQGNRTDKVIF